MDHLGDLGEDFVNAYTDFEKGIAKMQTLVHRNAKDKGWWDLFESGKAMEKNPLEVHALIHSEIAEATEEARKNAPPVYVINYEGKPAAIEILSPESFVMVDGEERTPIKPEGELIELADAVIRILDYCGSRGWDLGAAIAAKHRYNTTRPHRHGGKKY